MTKATKVVCLVGGYVAMHLVKSMKKAINKGKVELTIIDKILNKNGINIIEVKCDFKETQKIEEQIKKEF